MMTKATKPITAVRLYALLRLPLIATEEREQEALQPHHQQGGVDAEMMDLGQHETERGQQEEGQVHWQADGLRAQVVDLLGSDEGEGDGEAGPDIVVMGPELRCVGQVVAKNDGESQHRELRQEEGRHRVAFATDVEPRDGAGGEDEEQQDEGAFIKLMPFCP